MICLRKLPHLKIYSIFAFLFFSFFFAFGISQDSYATSVTCSVSNSITAYSGESNGISYPACDLSSFSSDTSTYYITETVSVHLERSSSGSVYFVYRPFFRNSSYSRSYESFDFYLGNSSTSSDFTNTYYYTRSIDLTSSTYRVYGVSRSTSYLSSNSTFSSTYTISDEPFTQDSEPCPVCPEIPDNPYDNKFDAITKAIYTCGAVLIMLYFFFCIYKIIVKDGGSR